MIGVIADDLTGATDVAAAFASAGCRVDLFFAAGGAEASPTDADVLVVGLKTRTMPTADAVAQSVTAARSLRAQGCTQLFFKYCSTFDSTPAGNIGPVADALAAEMASTTVVFAPTTPAQQRTVYMGHLFVGDTLLSNSPMRHHPLTPMTDADLRRVLSPQTTRTVGLLDHATVRTGVDAVIARIADLAADGVGAVVADALDDQDLDVLAGSLRDAPLVTGAAGLASALGRARMSSMDQRRGTADEEAVLAPSTGRSAVIAGSCSARTRDQIGQWRADGRPWFSLDAITTPDSEALADLALAWVDGLEEGASPLIFSSADPSELRRVQDALGVERAATVIEGALGRITVGLTSRGFDRLVVAGGETSGEVVRALGVTHARVGAEAAPGVPWIFPLTSTARTPSALLLKSGNYGDADLFLRVAGGIR